MRYSIYRYLALLALVCGDTPLAAVLCRHVIEGSANSKVGRNMRDKALSAFPKLSELKKRGLMTGNERTRLTAAYTHCSRVMHGRRMRYATMRRCIRDAKIILRVKRKPESN